jgi:hypothetical protein
MAPDWWLRASRDRAPMTDAELLGEDRVDTGVQCALYRHAHGFRLAYSDTGIFDISPDGRHIVWVPEAGAQMEAARLDVIGRVLAAALHASGTLCLHGSAVSVRGGAIAFLAPKFHGKSTLAFALVRAGARLITDDTLPVDPGPPAMAHPGVQHVRLWDDSVDQLSRRRGRAAQPQRGEKQVVQHIPGDRITPARTPLSAVYLLSPVAANTSNPPARRMLLQPVAAAVSLVRHAKLGPLLGKREATVLFEQAVSIARDVPVYALEVVRDYGRLADVVSSLVAWHTQSATTAVEPIGVVA